MEICSQTLDVALCDRVRHDTTCSSHRGKRTIRSYTGVTREHTLHLPISGRKLQSSIRCTRRSNSKSCSPRSLFERRSTIRLNQRTRQVQILQRIQIRLSNILRLRKMLRRQILLNTGSHARDLLLAHSTPQLSVDEPRQNNINPDRREVERQRLRKALESVHHAVGDNPVWPGSECDRAGGECDGAVRSGREVLLRVLTDHHGGEVADHVSLDGGVDGDLFQGFGDACERIAGGVDCCARQILCRYNVRWLLTDVVQFADLLEQVDEVVFQSRLITDVTGITRDSVFR